MMNGRLLDFGATAVLWEWIGNVMTIKIIGFSTRVRTGKANGKCLKGIIFKIFSRHAK